MSESNVNQIEGYGSMVCEAMNIDCTPLTSCLDSIIKTFEEYLRMLETVREYIGKHAYSHQAQMGLTFLSNQITRVDEY